MEPREAEELIGLQKAYFHSGKTLPVAARKEALCRLRKAIDDNEEAICEALYQDLGKSRSESYMCEVGLARSEISYMIKHVGRYAKEKRVPTPLANFPSASIVKPTPYGCVLIMSPWNYPFLLTIDPLADALAAGNTAVLKPSAYSPHTSAVIQKIIESCFPREYVAVVNGGRAENACLMGMPFDEIFFTGSRSVGREVMAQAASRLTPVVLELGGKSPCIVDKTANLSLAAKRIVFGKYLNCGQTCIAPDFIYCDAEVSDTLIKEIKKQIRLQYGENPLENETYGKIINQKHFNRLCGLMEKDKVVYGGGSSAEQLKIEPTVMAPVSFDDPIMGEEIFGPILPILTYEKFQDAVEKLRSMPSPLACYIFSTDWENIACVKNMIPFGGGCINDVVVHLATSELGFGGVGESGMGMYHGKTGFDAFTHYKSILKNQNLLDLPIRYQPYNRFRDMLVRMFVR